MNNNLETGNIGKLLLSLAIPSIIAQLVNVLYNMVDRIYIGQMTNGTTAMAALSVALPIVTFVMAFTQLVGTGGAPLCAIRLGEKRQDKAEQIMTTSFVMLLTLGLVLTLIIEVFAQPLLVLFGANSETLLLASRYIRIYAIGNIFVMITLGMNAYINTQGFAKFGMATVLIGAILNIILDPIFIFVFNMGVSGAALATILAQCVSALWVLKFLFGKKSTIHMRKEYVKVDPKICIAIMSLGISPFVMQSTESLLQISFNNQLLNYGGNIAVATMAILLSLQQFVTLPLQGLCQGAQPIMSYNYGAKNFERVRNTFKLVFFLCLGLSFVCTGTVLIFSKTFVSIFASDPMTVKFASWAIRIYLVGMLTFGMQIACQQSFMALGQAKISLSMALLRKVILLIPLIYILPIIMGTSSMAISLSQPIASMVYDSGRCFSVLFAEPVSDILAACTTTLMFMRFYKKNLVD
ncbi:MAG: MATE family efflux transporter [Bacillota bacterium]|nr:MATE family efflux transporter [Bacillota bacterium]